MFVCTANTLNIPPALLDRMEIIRIAGYTEQEKNQIAKKYLIPKQQLNHGLKKKEISFSASNIKNIIQFYTREAGVRNLEKEISKICRKSIKLLELGPKKLTGRDEYDDLFFEKIDMIDDFIIEGKNFI